MQIREKDLSVTESRILWRNRFFDFNDHFGASPDLLAARQSSTRLGVLVVCNTAPFTRAFLKEHCVAFISQGFHPRRNHAYPVFVVLDFLWNANNHAVSSRRLCLSSPANPIRPSRDRSVPSAIFRCSPHRSISTLR